MPLGMGLLYLLHFLVARDFGAEAYGEFVFAVAVGSILAILVTGGGPASAQKFISYYSSANNVDTKNRFIVYGLWYLCCSSFVILLAALVLILAGHYFDFETQTYFNSLLVAGATLLWLWQRYVCLGHGRVILAIVPRDILMPCALVLILILSVDTVSIQTFIYYYSAATALFCLSALYLCTKTVVDIQLKQLRLPELQSWLLSGRSFMITTAMQLGLNNWDLIILGMFAGLEETGKYAAASRLAMVLLIVVRIANTLIGHKFSALFADGDTKRAFVYFRQIRSYCFYIGLAVFGVLIVSHEYIFSVIGDDYSGLGVLLIIFAVANFLCVAFGPVVQYLNMTGRESEVAKLMLFWSLVSVLGNLVAIPLSGVMGAALVYFISNIGLRWHLSVLMNRKAIANSV